MTWKGDTVSMFGEGRNMGAARGQKGQLYRKGPSWIIRWWEDVRAIDGTVTRARFSRVIAAAAGPKAIGQREAWRIAWDEILSRLDAAATRPQSLLTVAEFWHQKFIPEWIWSLKPAGKKHYRYLERAILEWCPDCHGRRFWKKAGAREWICQNCTPEPKEPEQGEFEFMETAGEFANKTLRAVTPQDIQNLIRAGVERGLSPQTVTHWKNGLSGLFNHAQGAGYVRENPAHHVRLPAMQRKEQHALSFDQGRKLLSALPPLIRAAAMFSALTSLNVSELAGLRWQRLNLTAEHKTVDGEPLPPFSAAVREHYYRGQRTTLKAGRRRRIVPLPATLVQTLIEWRRQSAHAQDPDPVFCGAAGQPLNENNSRRRILQPTARRVLGIDWVGWHTFRRCAATWADAVDMAFSDRMALLGHGRIDTTLTYTKQSTERRRASLEEMAQLLFHSGGNTIQ